MQLVRDWFRRHFSDPQVVLLALLLTGGFVIIILFGRILAPVLAAVVIAYLLESPVRALQRLKLPRFWAVIIVALVFIGFLFIAMLGLLPLLTRQVGQLVQQAPSMIATGQEALMRLPERYPEFVSEQQIAQIMGMLRSEVTQFGQTVVSRSIDSVRGLITFLVYLVLMPLLVFFFLKDKERILGWLKAFLPEERSLAMHVWYDVDRQIGNYVRGKFWEILVVWGVTFATLSLLKLPYAMLLSFFVGLSVLVPYIGAMVMAVPVGLIAYFQWGWGSEMLWTLVAYTVIQILDGNLLAPLLLSDVTNLHPVAVVVAVLFFGGLWGFWGFFFAIPLATLVHAVVKAWPSKRRGRQQEAQTPGTQPARAEAPAAGAAAEAPAE